MSGANSKVKILLLVGGAMCVVHVLNVLTHYQLTRFGIFPRSTASLPFIFTAPFLHGNLGHLLNNLTGLAVFSSLCLLRSIRFYVMSSLFIIALSGLLVWLFGRPATHIGASGWIFGLWSLTIAMAWFDRRFINIVIAVFVIFFYGGMFYGVLPSDPRISYEAHLFGAIAGIVWAVLIAKTNKNRRRA